MGHGNCVGLFNGKVPPLLIDCGTRNSEKEINFLNHIDAQLKKTQTGDLVITHYHFDHYSLINKFSNDFFNNIYLPALPHYSATADAMLRYLSVASVLAYQDFYLTPIIASRTKNVQPLVKDQLFTALDRNWEVLWPDYTVIDTRNKRRVKKFLGEIGRIVEKLTPEELEEFEKTYASLSRVFSEQSQ